MMPTRRRDDGDGHGEAYGRKKKPRPSPQKQHLYLVLDDWDRGYSIHKLDVDDDSDTGIIHGDLATDGGGGPALRLAARGSPYGMRFFPMRGGHIAVVSDASPTLVYDTAAAALVTGPTLPGLLSAAAGGGGIALAMPGGEKVYALTSLGDGFPFVFEAFSPDDDCRWLPWAWRNEAAPPPPPFEGDVTAYAVHPDGHTVFVSTSGGGGTYTLDTRRGGEWRRRGDWVLPFHGQGFFDVELDAWVGLRHVDTVCVCQVPSRSGAGAGGAWPPEWDTLDDDDHGVVSSSSRGRRRQHGGRRHGTLSYMGDSRFCVVESVELDEEEEEDDDDVAELAPKFEIHVAVFGLKYNRRGELKTMARRAAGSFRAPKHFSRFSPVAFWINRIILNKSPTPPPPPSATAIPMGATASVLSLPTAAATIPAAATAIAGAAGCFALGYLLAVARLPRHAASGETSDDDSEDDSEEDDDDENSGRGKAAKRAPARKRAGLRLLFWARNVVTKSDSVKETERAFKARTAAANLLEVENLAEIIEDFKMVLVVRNDLKMGKGKIAAQCSPLAGDNTDRS
uniref:peptidyl-tRNA hydrolase n=1 Tax=Leersia perrieri TaxID=77586 RepID=A0A0D9WAG2_9ORYZ